MSVYATPGPGNTCTTPAPQKKRRKPRKITRRHRRLKGQAPPNATSAKNVNSYHACLLSTTFHEKKIRPHRTPKASRPLITQIFCCPSPFPFCGSRVWRLACGPAGYQTTTSLSAPSRTTPYQLSHEDTSTSATQNEIVSLWPRLPPNDGRCQFVPRLVRNTCTSKKTMGQEEGHMQL